MGEHQETHRLATEAAKCLVRGGIDAGLKWTDISVACETAVTIVVLMLAEISNTPDKGRFAQEIIDTMTEHAHRRVQCAIRGVPYDG